MDFNLLALVSIFVILCFQDNIKTLLDAIAERIKNGKK